MPITKGKAPSPGTLKMGFIIFVNFFPSISIMSVEASNSQAMKKGKRAGTTEVTQSLSPFFCS